MSRLLAALVFVVLSSGSVRAEPPREVSGPIAVVLEDASPATRRAVEAGIAGLGGRVLHSFDDLLVVEVPTGREFSAYRLPGVREVALNGLTAGGGRGAGPSFGRAAWNAIAAGSQRSERETARLAMPEQDALVSPSATLESVREASLAAKAPAAIAHARLGAGMASTMAGTGAPFGGNELTTSEFLAGAVSVNVILIESEGTIDPSLENWSSARETEVVSRIAAGLEWVRAEEPQAAVRFVYHVYAGRTDARARTGYEPIRRSADPTGTAGEDLWVKDVLARFGYTSGDRFARSRAFASDTRQADGTDWAVNVFVVDSLADGDGKFADGRFAYCWIGGPHLVMTYDNGPWGSARMDMVLRHELLHAFYAFDEYASSACACKEHRGYLDGFNANCESCNAVAGACVMISNGDAMCDATRRHLGWADLDGDGVIDVVGEDPDTFLDALPPDACSAPVLSGLATVVAATDRNTYGGVSHPSISVNRVAAVEVRADDASWVAFQPPGAPMPQTPFSVQVLGLAPGSHRLEARAVDDFGNLDLDPGKTELVVHAAVGSLGDSVHVSRAGASGVAITWAACEGATLYRVYRRASPGGAASAVAESSTPSWSDAAASSGFYEVRPVDACGGEGLQ